jgi:hypothetical protein
MTGLSVAYRHNGCTDTQPPPEVTMQLTLTPEESSLLIRNLMQRIEHLDSELVHTDKRDLQRDLARELQALRTLTDRIRSSASPIREQAPFRAL